MLLRVEDVARMLAVSKPQVYKLIREEGLPHCRLSERTIRFIEAEINKWLVTRKG